MELYSNIITGIIVMIMSIVLIAILGLLSFMLISCLKTLIMDLIEGMKGE